MVEEIAKDLFCINIPLHKNPLGNINCYLLRGEDSDLLIDTGFRTEEGYQVLEEDLVKIGSKRDKRDVLITHLHPDHCGLADVMAGDQRRIYISGIDLARIRKSVESGVILPMQERYIEEGFPAEDLHRFVDPYEKGRPLFPELSDRFIPLVDGDRITVGSRTLTTLIVPGHTPGNTMLWCETTMEMFSGDHILFNITPNIGIWEGMEDSLGAYLDSLHRVYSYPVKTTYPAHRHAGDYHMRIEELLAHYEGRLREAMSIIETKEGQTAYQIASKMTWHIRAKSWADFPLSQRFYAMGECLSHLDHLRSEGKIVRLSGANGYRYECIEI